MKSSNKLSASSFVAAVCLSGALLGLNPACAVAQTPQAKAPQGDKMNMPATQTPQAAAPRMDKRKQTTVQTAAVDVGATKNAVMVRYLNLPFGEVTFGHMEKGGNQYYSNRTWPIAHLTLAVPATVDNKPLPAGDYVVYITPKGMATDATAKDGMTWTFASFKPATAGGTYLVAGDVFTATPKDAQVVISEPVTFAQGTQALDHLQIALEKSGDKTVTMKVQYGNRAHSETLTVQ